MWNEVLKNYNILLLGKIRYQSVYRVQVFFYKKKIKLYLDSRKNYQTVIDSCGIMGELWTIFFLLFFSYFYFYIYFLFLKIMITKSLKWSIKGKRIITDRVLPVY